MSKRIYCEDFNYVKISVIIVSDKENKQFYEIGGFYYE